MERFFDMKVEESYILVRFFSPQASTQQIIASQVSVFELLLTFTLGIYLTWHLSHIVKRTSYLYHQGGATNYVWGDSAYF